MLNENDEEDLLIKTQKDIQIYSDIIMVFERRKDIVGHGILIIVTVVIVFAGVVVVVVVLVIIVVGAVDEDADV